MSTTKYPDPTAMKGLLLFALQSPSVRKITSTRMTATAAKMDLVVDPFCARQFAESGEASRRYGGTVFTTSISAFEDIVNARYDESHLKDGYAPFCKHLFIENDFTDAKVNVLEISEMNQDKLRSKYEARNEKELPVLTRWFPRELVGDELPVAKYLDLIIYSRDQINKENAAMDKEPSGEEAPWGIVSIKAQDVDYELPMTPITAMRNALGKDEGGSGIPINRDAYMEAVSYWKDHASIS
jgi:hypothetical protein